MWHLCLWGELTVLHCWGRREGNRENSLGLVGFFFNCMSHQAPSSPVCGHLPWITGMT